MPYLRPVRLVPLLTDDIPWALDEPPFDLPPFADAPTAADASPAMAEYDARRCAGCGARHSSFGFGPPLCRDKTTVWACGACRHEVDRQMILTGMYVRARPDPAPQPGGEVQTSRAEPRQLTLL